MDSSTPGWLLERMASRRCSPSISLTGDELVLEGGGIRIEYLDREVASPDLELTGHTWTVDTIVEHGVATRSEWPSPATLAFDAGGTVTIDTGCNLGSATYEVSRRELTFGDVTVTEQACDGASAPLENAVLELLGSSHGWSWRTSLERLALRRDETGLELVASDG